MQAKENHHITNAATMTNKVAVFFTSGYSQHKITAFVHGATELLD